MHSEYVSYIKDSPFSEQYNVYTKFVSDTYKPLLICCNVYEKLHNIYGPSKEYYGQYHTVSSIEYWINGKLHNEHGPAAMVYHSDGTISRTENWIDGIEVDKL